MDVPEHIDRYELRGTLGHGAMGHVYCAWDTKIEREVALKLVSPTADDKTRERFHREVCAIVSLGHPNIVEIYDYSGPRNEQLYYVMEKLDGDDLYDIFRSHGPIPEAAAAAVGYELCLALAVMHEAGIIHRDLKPENVFVTARGRTVLTDFGVVKAVRDNTAVSGFDAKTDIVGTPGFMAPEQLASKPLGGYTDIFALGALLYNVVTGELPFPSASPLEMYDLIESGKLIDPREHRPELGARFSLCVTQCLAARPKDRPQSANLVREQLTAVLDAHGVSDLRDELSAYMRNPQSYCENARREAPYHLERELDQALVERDTRRTTALRRQLSRLGIHHVGTEPQGSSVTHQPEPRRGYKRRLVVVTLVVLAGIAATGVFCIDGWKQRLVGVFRQQRTPEVSAPVAVVEDGILEVQLQGRGVVTVSGARLAADELRGKRLAAGAYHLEVSGGPRLLVLDVTLTAGKRLVVRADPKRGRIRIK